jgi:thiol-disulfide isomerase/thioredoxin
LPSVSLPSNILQLADADRLGWYNQWEAQTAEGQRHLTQRTAGEREAFVNLKSDGSFMLADMAEGSALMRVFFFPVVNNEADYEHLISGAAYEFKVPAADGSSAMKPLDIGTLAPRAAETINAGQMVPDIAFRDRQGADHLLSQFRGKIVFLDFWGTWCGVCLHDLPDVKAINDTYGSNPHFSMISLSVGDDRTTWENFIEKNRMTWLQSCLGTRDQAWQARLFGVPGYPSYWIIGPDGKVLADGYHSSLLRPIIDQALKGLK